MPLPPSELAYLTSRGEPFEVSTEGNMLCVVIRGYRLPPGYSRPSVDLFLRLPTGFPDLPPDMWWFDPPAQRADGQVIQAADAVEQHLGRAWQRWSRHFNQGQWRSGVDTLESFLALIRKELERCALKVA